MNPILVIGMNRGGTTMLGNVLCRCPQIVAPQHELHWGCKESQVLLHKQHWTEFDQDDGYAAFLDAYCSGDYFNLANGDREYFEREKPSSFYEFFLELMDQFADAEGARYWVMKVEERFYHYPKELDAFITMLLDRYANPRFIGIIRNFEGVLKSHLRRRVTDDDVASSKLSFGQQKFALSQTLRYAAQRPKIRNLMARHHGLLLDFADVVGDPESAHRRICDFLGVDYSPEMGEREYAPNTSFKNKRERKEIIAPWQYALLDKVARPVFEALHPVGSTWRRFKDARMPEVSPVAYRLRDADLLSNGHAGRAMRPADVGGLSAAQSAISEIR